MNSTLTPVRRRLLARIAAAGRPVASREIRDWNQQYPASRFNFLPDLWRDGYVTDVPMPDGVPGWDVAYIVTPRGRRALERDA